MVRAGVPIRVRHGSCHQNLRAQAPDLLGAEKAMDRTRRTLLKACGMLALPGTLLANAGPFRIGVAPHTSARVIIEQYQPLRRHLERQLGRPALVVTAPDFNDFIRRALRNEFDLVVTTGHQARLLQTDAGYLPLLTYQSEFKAFAVVAKQGPVQRPADLAGKVVLGLSPTSLVTLWGWHWLQDQNLRQTATPRHVSAADSVAQQVLGGEAAAGFMSSANFDKLPEASRSRLRVLAESDSLAGRVYVLNPHSGVSRESMESTLFEFASGTEGKQYFATNHLGGYRKLRPNELAQMDRYAAEVRLAIAQ